MQKRFIFKDQNCYNKNFAYIIYNKLIIFYYHKFYIFFVIN